MFDAAPFNNVKLKPCDIFYLVFNGQCKDVIIFFKKNFVCDFL